MSDLLLAREAGNAFDETHFVMAQAAQLKTLIRVREWSGVPHDIPSQAIDQNQQSHCKSIVNNKNVQLMACASHSANIR